MSSFGVGSGGSIHLIFHSPTTSRARRLGRIATASLLLSLLLIFGATPRPELGSGLGKGIREFKRPMREINMEIDREEPPQQINTTTRTAVPSSTEKKEPTDTV